MAQASSRPTILLSNDDGIDAKGLAALASALDGLGDLRVVAPEREQSAVGHAITVRDPIRAYTHAFEVPSGPIPAWAVTGTPADCIKLAVWNLLDRKPDLVVSGINMGPNTAVNVLYSGTVSAASEACILGIPSIAVSLCSWTATDFEAAGRFARRIAGRVLHRGLPSGVLLNVNVPNLPLDDIRGIDVTRLARARWEEEFSARVDPLQRPYYWLTGTFHNLEDEDENDLGAVDRGFVSVTPLHLDLTAYAFLKDLRSWNWTEEEDPAS